MNKSLFVLLLAFLTACNDAENDTDAITKEQQQQLEALQKNAEKYPDSVGVQLQLVNIYDSVGEYKKAHELVTKLIAKDSANYGLWYKKAHLEEFLKDTANAIASYSSALRIYNSPDGMLSLANLYAETKNARALDICNLVGKMGLGRETDADCYFIAGVYHARTGHFDQALQLFDKCISNNYTYMEAYIEKGLLYFDRKDYRKALEIFSFASTVNNLYADAYYYMARCYEMMQMKDSAAVRFQQALSLDKSLTEAKQGLKRIDKNNE